uniref:Uncharacterized protein n=1 Tax=Daphnia magna TaxID=35525 RepID=A0A0P6IQ91_9CRUS
MQIAIAKAFGVTHTHMTAEISRVNTHKLYAIATSVRIRVFTRGVTFFKWQKESCFATTCYYTVTNTSVEDVNKSTEVMPYTCRSPQKSSGGLRAWNSRGAYIYARGYM